MMILSAKPRRSEARKMRAERVMSLKERLWERKTWRELDSWLLWSGISPEAHEPFSHIGIYTDFT